MPNSLWKIKKISSRSKTRAADFLNSTMTSESACTVIDNELCEHCQLQNFFYKSQNLIKCQCRIKKTADDSTVLKKRHRYERKRQRITGSFKSTVHVKFIKLRCNVQAFTSNWSNSDINGSFLCRMGNSEGNKFNQFGQLQVWYV